MSIKDKIKFIIGDNCNTDFEVYDNDGTITILNWKNELPIPNINDINKVKINDLPVVQKPQTTDDIITGILNRLNKLEQNIAPKGLKS